jgi:hypothetical protein
LLAGKAVEDFFRTGVFNFQVPGCSNVNFVIPKEEFEKNHRFLDVLGAQAYGDARLVLGWNGGEPYPGPKVNNLTWGNFGFSAGATAEDGKRVSSFGPEIDPSTFKGVLERARLISDRIHITEIGCDARSQKRGEVMRLDREVQRKYFEDLAPILAEFQDNIEVFLVWTLFGGAGADEAGQLEWQRGKETNLPVMKVIRGPDRRIVDYEMTPATELLRESFGQAQERAAVEAM